MFVAPIGTSSQDAMLFVFVVRSCVESCFADLGLGCLVEVFHPMYVTQLPCFFFLFAAMATIDALYEMYVDYVEACPKSSVNMSKLVSRKQ